MIYLYYLSNKETNLCVSLISNQQMANKQKNLCEQKGKFTGKILKSSTNNFPSWISYKNHVTSHDIQWICSFHGHFRTFHVHVYLPKTNKALQKHKSLMHKQWFTTKAEFLTLEKLDKNKYPGICLGYSRASRLHHTLMCSVREHMKTQSIMRLLYIYNTCLRNKAGGNWMEIWP